MSRFIVCGWQKERLTNMIAKIWGIYLNTLLSITFFFPLLVVVAQEEPVEPVVEGDEEEGVVKVACHYIYFKL